MELRSETLGATIYYTLNGGKPQPFAPASSVGGRATRRYTAALRLPAGRVVVRAVAVSDDGLRESHVVSKVPSSDRMSDGCARRVAQPEYGWSCSCRHLR